VKIVGGENADIKDFPYSVSIAMLNFKSHFCGGTIISNWHILTAAHCVVGRNASLIRIYTGNSNLENSNEQSYGILSIIIHPKYTNDIRSDIAIIMVFLIVKETNYICIS
jgi:secreted trypsin-like serine protease